MRLRFLLELVREPLVRRASYLKYMKRKPPLLSAYYSSLWASRPPTPSTTIIPCVSFSSAPEADNQVRHIFACFIAKTFFFFFCFSVFERQSRTVGWEYFTILLSSVGRKITGASQALWDQQWIRKDGVYGREKHLQSKGLRPWGNNLMNWVKLGICPYLNTTANFSPLKSLVRTV